ncbi:hypothetical protein F8388_019263 [Cannabis sativa]|uniref:RNase H type-1 domain-containing protein n=1 Tax=Cannabis sativa TaxID=3483 RepID=A0A7J6FQT6_CANSA|nr:hypothetical protein F8388_019263 [Cannabis sativa]
MLAEVNNNYDPRVILEPDQVQQQSNVEASAGCFQVDASFADGIAGIGVVVKRPGAADSESCQSSCLAHNVLEAELVAILSALEYAWNARIQSIVIQSDSKIVVDALNLRELPMAWGTYPVFSNCFYFYSSQSEQFGGFPGLSSQSKSSVPIFSGLGESPPLLVGDLVAI